MIPLQWLPAEDWVDRYARNPESMLADLAGYAGAALRRTAYNQILPPRPTFIGELFGVDDASHEAGDIERARAFFAENPAQISVGTREAPFGVSYDVIRTVTPVRAVSLDELRHSRTSVQDWFGLTVVPLLADILADRLKQLFASIPNSIDVIKHPEDLRDLRGLVRDPGAVIVDTPALVSRRLNGRDLATATGLPVVEVNRAGRFARDFILVRSHYWGDHVVITDSLRPTIQFDGGNLVASLEIWDGCGLRTAQGWKPFGVVVPA